MQCKTSDLSQQCDQSEPICGRCARSGSRCSLIDSRPLRSMVFSSTSLARNQASGIMTPPEEPMLIDFSSTRSLPSNLRNLHGVSLLNDSMIVLAPIDSQLGLLDLALLHHYTTVACFFLSNIPWKQRIWQSVVPREASKYDFLMHAVLALSAVHLMYTCPPRAHLYEKAARNHRNLALTLSVPLFNDVTPTNCHALFVLTNIVAILAFIFPHTPEHAATPSPLDHIVDFFMLIRGVKTVLKTAFEWVDKGPFAELSCYHWNPETLPLPDDVQIAFDRLIQQNENRTNNLEDWQTYDQTIQDLRTCFQTYRNISDEPSLVFVWVKLVQEPYVAALKRLEPMALAILAHWAVLLHSVKFEWGSGDRGSLLIEDIVRLISPEWLPAVQWPRDVMSADWTSVHHMEEADRIWWDLFESNPHEIKVIDYRAA